MEKPIALEAPADILQSLKDRLSGTDFEWSEPRAVTSVADALDSPIGGEEVRQTLELVVLICKTGAAAMALAKTMYEIIQVRKKAAVVVKDPMTGQEHATITADTSAAQVQRILAP